MNPERELRMVVTQRCNYKCTFCHGEGMQSRQEDNLCPEDYRFLYYTGKKHFGFNSTTLSGGEPLYRNDIIDIAKGIKEEGAYITLTTNGSLLGRRLGIGNYIDRINLSLHTTNPERYGSLVGKEGAYHKVISNIKMFSEQYPNVEIRLNAALVDGLNSSEHEVKYYISLARYLKASVKYLELYPKNADGFVPISRLENIIFGNGFKPIESRTRRKDYQLGSTKVGLSKIFCSSAEDSDDAGEYCYRNNDMFVNPEGSMKPCRAMPHAIDFLQEVRGKDEKRLAEKIKAALSMLGKNCLLMKSEVKK